MLFRSRCTTAEQHLRQETAKRAEAAATIGPAPLVERAAPAALAPLSKVAAWLCLWELAAPTGYVFGGQLPLPVPGRRPRSYP